MFFGKSEIVQLRVTRSQLEKKDVLLYNLLEEFSPLCVNFSLDVFDFSPDELWNQETKWIIENQNAAVCEPRYMCCRCGIPHLKSSGSEKAHCYAPFTFHSNWSIKRIRNFSFGKVYYLKELFQSTWLDSWLKTSSIRCNFWSVTPEMKTV